jgi:hypothetical protein
MLGYAEAIERMDLGESSDTSVSYIGYARKRVQQRESRRTT